MLTFRQRAVALAAPFAQTGIMCRVRGTGKLAPYTFVLPPPTKKLTRPPFPTVDVDEVAF